MAVEQELLRRVSAFLNRSLSSPSDLTEWVAEACEFHRWVRGRGNAEEVPHHFWHYLSDADIYLKEPDYRSQQEGEIREWLSTTAARKP